MSTRARAELATSLLLAEPKCAVEGCPELMAHQASDILEFWESWEALTREREEPPFWGAVWPGAALVARVLTDEPALVSGRRVWDLGCGSGIAAIAAIRAGAGEVIANDIDAAALAATALHAALNGVQLRLLHEDLTAAPVRFGSGDVLIVSDLFYEGARSPPLLALLHAARARGADVLIADGGRAFAPRDGLCLLREAVLPVARTLEGVAERKVRLFTLA